MSQSGFIPSAILERLSKGSFQSIISEADKAIRLAKSKLFGRDVRVEVLATFPDKVVALVDGNPVEFVLKTTPQGLQISEANDLTVPGFGESHVSAQLGEAVSSFLAGDKAKARAFLSEAVCPPQLVGAARVREVANRAISNLQAERPWKKILESKTAEILKIAGDPTDKPPRPQFAYLGDEGDTSGYPDPAHLETIHPALASLAERLSTLADSVTSSLTMLSELAKNATPEDKNLFTSLESFATDLARDLRSHKTAVKESLVMSVPMLHPNNVISLARLHDTLAGQWSSFETSARFIDRLTSELKTARKQHA